MIPGSNLLLDALELIEPTPVEYQQFTGRTLDGVGKYQDTYAPAIGVLQGSLQPLPRTRYAVLGLEQSQEYYTWFVPRAVVGLERDSAGDMIVWNGKKLKLQLETDWSAIDGWVSVVCVVIKKNA